MLFNIFCLIVISAVIAFFPAYNDYRYPKYVGDKPPALSGFFAGWLTWAVVWLIGLSAAWSLSSLMGSGGECIPSRSTPC